MSVSVVALDLFVARKGRGRICKLSCHLCDWLGREAGEGEKTWQCNYVRAVRSHWISCPVPLNLVVRTECELGLVTCHRSTLGRMS